MESRSRYLGSLLSSVVVAAFVVLPCWAQSIDPGILTVSTPRYEPAVESFRPPLGRYVYEVSWQGIAAAEAAIELTEEGGVYRLVATAKTASGIDLLYKLRYRGEGWIRGDTLRPLSLRALDQENARVRTMNMTFGPDGLIDAIRTTARDGKLRDSKRLQFVSENDTLDPFSSALLARSLPWTVGQHRSFDVFNGKTRYLITLTATERRQGRFLGKARDVLVIEPKVQNLTDPHKNNKLREVRILVSDDASREILKIESEVFIGSVTTELVRFEPATGPGGLRQELVVAANERRRTGHKYAG